MDFSKMFSRKVKSKKKKLNKEFTFDDVVEIEELLEDDD